eukprot:449474-Pyramimonas_sp.AAC.1
MSSLGVAAASASASSLPLSQESNVRPRRQQGMHAVAQTELYHGCRFVSQGVVKPIKDGEAEPK